MGAGSARPLADDDYRMLAQTRYMLRQFFAVSERVARQHGITPAQHQLLLAVRGWDRQTPPSISELAERLQLKVHSTGELVDRAEAKGLVERHWDPEDARRSLVVLTEEGEEKLAELHDLHQRELARLRSTFQDVIPDDDVLDLDAAPRERSGAA